MQIKKNMINKEDKKEISEYLLNILACPVCKGDLEYDRQNNELICRESKLAFRVEGGIPIMLIDKARKIN